MRSNNILAVWALATEAERQAGSTWYTSAHAIARHLAYSHGLTLETVAGVIAALSPRNRWERNLADAGMLLQDESAKVCTFGAQKTVAIDIIRANPSDVYGVESLLGKGLKTRAFFRTIHDPQTQVHVVVDGHAYAIFQGLRIPLSACHVSASEYRRIAEAYREAGRALGVFPSVVQATTWVTWRRIHGVS